MNRNKHENLLKYRLRGPAARVQDRKATDASGDRDTGSPLTTCDAATARTAASVHLPFYPRSLQCDFAAPPTKRWDLFPHPMALGSS